ncbi:MAG: hypothetical protein WBV94_29215 [Blastocatellia bacterium]
MKFTKPISREVDIDGNTFIVSFDQNGIDFRVKGKRKTAHTDWNGVLEIARGEDGTSAHEIFGVSASRPTGQHETERQEQISEPQTFGFNPTQEATSPQLQEHENAPPQTGKMADTNVSEHSQEERAHQATATTAPETDTDDDTREEFGRAVTAGETKREY